jgi:hypothetical protein
MKQIAALVAIMLAALAAFALILRIGAALSGHRGGGMAFVVADNIAPSHRQGVQIRPHTDPYTPVFHPLRHQPLLVLGLGDPKFADSNADSSIRIGRFDVADQTPTISSTVRPRCEHEHSSKIARGRL